MNRLVLLGIIGSLLLQLGCGGTSSPPSPPGPNGDHDRTVLDAPPSPRRVMIPPANRSLRGTVVQVWVFVDERGRVVSDSTRLEPPTRDRDFNQRLIREAVEWVFRPALRGGNAVASWFDYRIEMRN